MRQIVHFIVFFIGIYICQAQSPRTSWPMINGDSAHTSYASIALNFPLDVDTLDIGYRRENGVVLWDNMLFIADYADSNRLVVADLMTGDSLWSFGVPETGGGMSFIPAVSQGVVMVGGQGGKGLYALNAFTGDSLWFLPVGSLYGRCPVISDSLVYLPAEGLQCVNLHSGEVYWTFGTYILRGSSPAVDGENVYACQTNLVYGADKLTGDTAWINDSVNVGLFSSLAVDDLYLYLGYKSDVYALDKTNGAIAWSVQLDTNEAILDFPNAFAITPDYLLVKYFEDGASENKYLLLNKTTGEEVNRYTGVQKGYGSPTVINSYVVDYSTGRLQFYDLVSGDTVYTLTGVPVSNYPTQIIAARDKIYVSGHGPNIMVLKSSTSAVEDVVSDALRFTVYPNPVTDQTQLSFTLDKGSTVSLEIFSAAGTLISRGDLGVYPAGTSTFSLSTKDLMPDTYFVCLETQQGAAVQQIIKVD